MHHPTSRTTSSKYYYCSYVLALWLFECCVHVLAHATLVFLQETYSHKIIRIWGVLVDVLRRHVPVPEGKTRVFPALQPQYELILPIYVAAVVSRDKIVVVSAASAVSDPGQTVKK